MTACGFLYCLWAPCSAEAAAGTVARSLVSTRFDNNAQVKPCFLASWVSFLVQLSTKTHANPLFKPRVCSMSVSLLGTSTYIHIAWTLPVSPTPSRFQSEWEDRHRESDCLLILWLPWGRRKKGPASVLVLILVLQGAVDFVTNFKNEIVHILQGGSSITSTVKSWSLSACWFLRIFRWLCCGSNYDLFLCCYHCAGLPFVLLDYKLLWEQRGGTAVCWLLTKLSPVSPVTFSAQKIFDK